MIFPATLTKNWLCDRFSHVELKELNENRSSISITETKDPVQPEELCGASFLPNQLRIPIIWGNKLENPAV